jgi:hypothetical protein
MEAIEDLIKVISLDTKRSTQAAKVGKKAAV